MFPAGLAVDDEYAWQPRWGFAHRRMQFNGSYTTNFDGPGLFYLPLIRLDQRFVHPTLRVITPGAEIREDLIPLATPLHPRERARSRL